MEWYVTVREKKSKLAFVWLHGTEALQDTSSWATPSMPLPLCRAVPRICANTCLSLNFPQVLGTQWNCSKFLFSWHHNWKTYSALVVSVTPIRSRGIFTRPLGRMSEAPCALAITPLIASLVRDVLFHDVLILLIITMVTFRTFWGKVLEWELEDWGWGRRNAGACSWHCFSRSTWHLYGVFHSRIWLNLTTPMRQRSIRNHFIAE